MNTPSSAPLFRVTVSVGRVLNDKVAPLDECLQWAMAYVRERLAQGDARQATVELDTLDEQPATINGSDPLR